MIRGRLSREGRPPAPVQRVPVPPLTETAEITGPAWRTDEMPPRPRLRRPDPSLPPVTGGQPMDVYGDRRLEDDPCGGIPMTVSSDETGASK